MKKYRRNPKTIVLIITESRRERAFFLKYFSFALGTPILSVAIEKAFQGERKRIENKKAHFSGNGRKFNRK